MMGLFFFNPWKEAVNALESLGIYLFHHLNRNCCQQWRKGVLLFKSLSLEQYAQ